MLSFKKLSLVGMAFSQDCCLPPAQCGGLSGTGVCGYLPLSPGQESLWSGACPCPGCLHLTRLVAPAKGILEGPGKQENTRIGPMECQKALHQSTAAGDCSCPGLDGGGVSAGAYC